MIFVRWGIAQLCILAHIHTNLLERALMHVPSSNYSGRIFKTGHQLHCVSLWNNNCFDHDVFTQFIVRVCIAVACVITVTKKPQQQNAYSIIYITITFMMIDSDYTGTIPLHSENVYRTPAPPPAINVQFAPLPLTRLSGTQSPLNLTIYWKKKPS